MHELDFLQRMLRSNDTPLAAATLKRILTNGSKAVLLHVAQEAVFKVGLTKAARVVVAQEPLQLGRR